jgi:hypothetical protein
MQSGFALGGSTDGSTVRLSKISVVKIGLHRLLEGAIKRLNINRRFGLAQRLRARDLSHTHYH